MGAGRGRSRWGQSRNSCCLATSSPSAAPGGRVSEVLNRKRPLSLRMITRLEEGLSPPYDSLLAGVS